MLSQSHQGASHLNRFSRSNITSLARRRSGFAPTSVTFGDIRPEDPSDLKHVSGQARII